MKMTERIRKLREQSLNAENRISAERALLITESIGDGRCRTGTGSTGFSV